MSDEMIIKRDEGGRFVERPQHTPAWNSETARAAARKRWDMTRGAAAAGLVRAAAALNVDITHPVAAFGLVVEKQVKALLASERVDMVAVDKLRRMITGHDEGVESQRANAGAVPAGAVIASPAALMDLIRAIELSKDRDGAIDAAASDK